MAAASEAPEIRRLDRLRIGDWIVDPALNQLSRGSEIERLEPKTIEVLLSPARQAGQVMSREQLLAESWNGIAVSEGGRMGMSASSPLLGGEADSLCSI